MDQEKITLKCKNDEIPTQEKQGEILDAQPEIAYSKKEKKALPCLAIVLRKINAILSLITTVLLLDHAIFFSVWMLSRCSIQKSVWPMPIVLAVLMSVHALISILLVFLARKGGEKRRRKKYVKMNIATFVQRTTGILMIVLLPLHITGSANHFQPKILHAILHPIFFASVLAHVCISTSKALITLGIGNAKVVRIVDIVLTVVCGVTFVAGFVGFYLCLFMGVAR